MNEDYKFYRDNIATIFKHRADILSVPDYYYTKLPFKIRNLAPSATRKGFIKYLGEHQVYLGSLIRAWNEYPDLFVKKCPSENCAGGKAFIFSFSGSIISDCNSYSCICGECGTMVIGASDSRKYHERCIILTKIYNEDRETAEMFTSNKLKITDIKDMVRLFEAMDKAGR